MKKTGVYSLGVLQRPTIMELRKGGTSSRKVPSISVTFLTRQYLYLIFKFIIGPISGCNF